MMAVILLGLALGAQADDSIRYAVYWVGQIPAHVISVNLDDRSLLVTPKLAYDTPGQRRSFIGFLESHAPLAQVTGSYFGLSSSLPVGDIVYHGQKLFDGYIGSALVITPDNQARIVNARPREAREWSGYQSVLQGGVRLLQDGQYAVYPTDQGFNDPALFRPATRTAVGLKTLPNGQRWLVMVAVNTPVLLSQLARVMAGLDCRDAMTLDGGTSTGLAYGSEVIITPGRTLSNVLMVVKRPLPPAKRLYRMIRPTLGGRLTQYPHPQPIFATGATFLRDKALLGHTAAPAITTPRVVTPTAHEPVPLLPELPARAESVKARYTLDARHSGYRPIPSGRAMLPWPARR